MGRVTLSEKRCWLGHDRGGQFCNSVGLVVGLLAAHEGCVGRHEHVETRVWDKNGGEIVDIHVEGSVESEGSGQG